MKLVLRAVSLALVSLAVGAPARGGDTWPQFRGPAAAGVSTETTLPTKWSKTENVRWVVDVPGNGWSSPIVWKDTVYLTTALSPGAFKAPSPGIYGNDYIAELRAQGLSNEEITRRVRARDNEAPAEVGGDLEWRLIGLDVKTGATRFSHLIHKGQPFGGRHRKNTYASETPATDGERVFVYLGNVGLFAFTMAGEPVWSHAVEPKPTYNDFGTSSSPVVHQGRVHFLHDDQEAGYFAALDAKTGKELWRTPRDFTGKFVRTTFTTPFVWKNTLRTELITLGPQTVISYDLDGRELWRFEGVSMVGAPTPVATAERLIVGCGSPSEPVRPLVVFKPGAVGNVSLKEGEEQNAFALWRQFRGGPYITSPLVHDGRVYVLYDQGFFGAYELATGKQLYKARFPEGVPTFSASPWVHGDTIFNLAEDGTTWLVAAGDEFKLLGHNPLDEMSLATPALAHGSVFLRTASKLYRLGG